MSAPLKIVVCGMPRSGNRLIMRLLQRHGFEAEIRHYGSKKQFRVGGFGARAIMPLRNIEPQQASCSVRYPNEYPAADDPLRFKRPLAGPEMHYEHFWKALRFVAEFQVPLLCVAYEAVVADSDTEGRRIVSFAGDGRVSWKGWGEEVVDANAKWTTEHEDKP